MSHGHDGDHEGGHEMLCYGDVVVTPLVDAAGTPYVRVVCDEVVEPPPEPPPDPPPHEHDVTVWHPAGDTGHHHGADPLEVHPAITEWIETHPHGHLFRTIGHPWLSSPLENIHPWPHGKHAGFVNLAETWTNLDQGRQDNATPIEAYLLQTHVMGNAHEFTVRVHSWKGIFLLHGDGPAIDRIVAGGGWADYGMAMSQYKNAECPRPDNPPLPEQYRLEQPPYRAVAGTARQHILWSSLGPHPVMHPYYPPPPNRPNRLLSQTWNERPWSVPDFPDCTQELIHAGNPNQRRTHFQVFALRLYLDRYPGPGDYYTNVHGEIVDATEPGPNAVPLHIGTAVPPGDALLNRVVRHGDHEAAPIQIYAAGAELTPVYGDMVHH